MSSLFLRNQGFITFSFYLVRLKHLLEMSVISKANLYAVVKKNTNKNETGTEDRVSTTARIVRNCTEESGNPVD